MSTPADIFALLAMVPALTAAPVPQAQSNAVVLALCNGGTIAVALGKDSPPVMGVSPCCAKGCHNAKRRRKASEEN